ncbi:hypothetical protein PDIG_64110 [Penicillium digitatum PHI26]|uniref:Uncharacterized protein n=2 Tax=Penicillium digitatum TaxID=36651 RepID=K9G721_PEND2|nr:hypothetical protein PDIP_73460 [Penicillium digitatum Pd1]EKV07573.1 hypothetical protein PDIP_73460 [Penicillium digitatum Pd1]EKV09011.1 hypothetical protein PDIG_64110 [Penicillium digitatum PHI26]
MSGSIKCLTVDSPADRQGQIFSSDHASTQESKQLSQ